LAFNLYGQQQRSHCGAIGGFSDCITWQSKLYNVAHNHPSGSLKTSQADISITERLSNSGKMLGIAMDDHIIITKAGYLSFMKEG